MSIFHYISFWPSLRSAHGQSLFNRLIHRTLCLFLDTWWPKPLNISIGVLIVLDLSRHILLRHIIHLANISLVIAVIDSYLLRWFCHVFVLHSFHFLQFILWLITVGWELLVQFRIKIRKRFLWRSMWSLIFSHWLLNWDFLCDWAISHVKNGVLVLVSNYNVVI